MGLPQETVLHGGLQRVEGAAGGQQVQWIAGLDRSCDCREAGGVESFGRGAGPVQRPEETQVGGIGHGQALSVREAGPVYRGAA